MNVSYLYSYFFYKINVNMKYIDINYKITNFIKNLKMCMIMILYH